MSETTEFKVGDWVIYRPHADAPAEDGTVWRVSREYVHVRFAGDFTSKAVHRDLLELGQSGWTQHGQTAAQAEAEGLTHQISLRVSSELHDALAADADENGRTIAQSVRFHLKRALGL